MLAPGSILKDRYRIERYLARGGMGTVWLARDTTFATDVAVKQMIAEGDTARAAFRREGKILHRIRHRAIPMVLDSFSDESGDFLVMEFVPGEDLAAMTLRRPGPFPVDVVLDWTDQLLDALEYLHGYKPPIIHRDVKPQNLKLTTAREVVLLDFGLSKLEGGGDSSITNAGMSIHAFTRNFAPLEQQLGTGTDQRSDLYGLGATAYFLLTQDRPREAVMREGMVATGRADPLVPLHRATAGAVPEAVSDVIGRAMAIKADDRYATATGMRAALSAARGIS